MRHLFRSSIYTLFLVMGVSLFVSCASSKLHLKTGIAPVQSPPDSSPEYSIYAIGDAGKVNEQSKAVMSQLKALIKEASQPGMVIFLGDNIYPAGLPPESTDTKYLSARDALLNQVNGLPSFADEIVFIPGNHDWNEFKPGGLDAVRRQENFLETLGFPGLKMIPDHGCGGPVALVLNADVVLIIVDSQWWIHDWKKEPTINEGCAIQSRKDFINAFHHLVATHKTKQIVVALHHPLYTQGPHGGHFTLRDHLFPLTNVLEWLYLPMPVIGSIYPYYRSVIGHNQDNNHPRYKSLKEGLLHDLDYPGEIIFLSGHDHNLQYIRNEEGHFLISGSGSKQNAVANSKDLWYGHKAAGFMKLDFYAEGKVHLSVYEVEPETGALENVLSRFIVEEPRS